MTHGRARVGSRYTVLWKIGSIPVGGVAEVVEFEKARDLAWINITGVTQRGRFRLRDAGPGQTIVTFRLAYHSDGGLLGLIADRIAARLVGRSLLREPEKPSAPSGSHRPGAPNPASSSTRLLLVETSSIVALLC